MACPRIMACSLMQVGPGRWAFFNSDYRWSCKATASLDNYPKHPAATAIKLDTRPPPRSWGHATLFSRERAWHT